MSLHLTQPQQHHSNKWIMDIDGSIMLIMSATSGNHRRQGCFSNAALRSQDKKQQAWFQLLQQVRFSAESLTIINLASGKLLYGDTAASQLAHALRFNHTTVVLFLDNCGIGNAGIAALASSWKACPPPPPSTTTTLATLATFPPMGKVHPTQQPQLHNHEGGSSVQYVFLSYNQIGNAGVVALADTLNTSRIQVLKLESNLIGYVGAKALAYALRMNHCLHTLDLAGNDQLQNDGVLALAAALVENATLQRLDLRYCGIRSLSAARAAFLQSLRDDNKTLSKLQLQEDIDDEDGDGGSNEQQALSQACELEFYLRWNGLGRHAFGTMQIPATAWTRVISKAACTSSSTIPSSLLPLSLSLSSSLSTISAIAVPPHVMDKSDSIAGSSSVCFSLVTNLLYATLRTRPDLLIHR